MRFPVVALLVTSLVAPALVGGVSGCGSRKEPSAKSPTGPVTAKLAVAPPLVTPGERMTYRLSLRDLELGVYAITVGEITDVDGTPTIVVQSHAKSVGLASMVTKVDDYFTSWIDVATGRSRRFEAVENVREDGAEKEHVTVQLAARAGQLVPLTHHLDDGPATTEQQQVSFADVWDYNAFLVALRAWEGAPGAKITVEVFRSRYLWRIEMVLGEKGTLVTELGELPVLRFDAHSVKLDRAGNKYPNTDERDFSLWISDDDGRVPLKTEAKSDYGTIKMEIVDYQPGTGQRLRE
ncbi:MAG: DUF3108 domain-containing protein [Deltaproteobacteria bacterium]|nr:DUF3108 domain-containing protein [Deltaproteobacteria bacterium]